MFILTSSLIFFAFLLLIPQAYAQESCVYGLHFAMYMDSGSDSVLSDPWQRVYDMAVAFPCVDIIITSNPNNGVGTEFESDTWFAIQEIQSVGGLVVAYVSTDFNNGPKTTESIKAEMDQWMVWYPFIDGFFFDEMQNDVGNGFNGDNVAFYSELTNYARNTLGVSQTRGNPGTDIDEAFKNSVDNIKVFETSGGLPNLFSLFNDWKGQEEITLFSLTPHSVEGLTDAELADFVQESNQYVSHVYVQDDGNDGNPWDEVSTYFERTVELQAEANSNVPPEPPMDTDVTGCGTLNQNGATYTQVNNIFAEINCITISGNGITYNGNGFELMGNSGCSLGDESGDNAMTLSGDNITVENVTISFWRYGVVFIGDNNQLSDSSLTCITKYGGQFDGGTNSFFINNFCDNCQNGVHMAGGSNSDGNTIAGNEFRDSNHHQTHLHNGNNNNEIFDNNFFEITANEILDEGGANNVWHDNYYSTFDSPAEGCFDTNNDNICDAPKIGEGNQDNRAHVIPITGTTPDPPDPPVPPIVQTSLISIETELDGTELTGQWVEFSQNGITQHTGFSPESFVVNNNQPYEVFVGNFEGINFQQWANGITDNPRPFNINIDQTFTAQYVDTNISPPDPPTDPDLEERVSNLETSDVDQNNRISALELNWNKIWNWMTALFEATKTLLGL